MDRRGQGKLTAAKRPTPQRSDGIFPRPRPRKGKGQERIPRGGTKDKERGRDRSPRPEEGGMAANGKTESFMLLQRATTLLMGMPQQVEKQKTDVALGRIMWELLERKRGPGGEGYVVGDEDLLWATSSGGTSSLAMP